MFFGVIDWNVIQKTHAQKSSFSSNIQDCEEQETCRPSVSWFLPFSGVQRVTIGGDVDPEPVACRVDRGGSDAMVALTGFLFEHPIKKNTHLET